MKNTLTTKDLIQLLQTKHLLSQQEIADLVGTNQVRISRWSRAGAGRSYDDVLKLKALFDMLEKRGAHITKDIDK